MQNPMIVELYNKLMSSPLEDLYLRAGRVAQTAHGMLQDIGPEADGHVAGAINNVAATFREVHSLLEEAKSETKEFSVLLREYLDVTLFEISEHACCQGKINVSADATKYPNMVIDKHPLALDIFGVAKLVTNEDLEEIIRHDPNEFDVVTDSEYTMHHIMLRYVIPLYTMLKEPANYIRDSFMLPEKIANAVDDVVTNFLNPLDDILTGEDIEGYLAYDDNGAWSNLYDCMTMRQIVPLKNACNRFAAGIKFIKGLLSKLADTHTVLKIAVEMHEEASKITF